MGMHRGEHVTEKQRLSLFKKLFLVSKIDKCWISLRCTHVVPSEMESDHADWSVARDHALVSYVDTLCRALSTTPSRLMPDELFLSEVDFTNENFHNLQGELTTAQ